MMVKVPIAGRVKTRLARSIGIGTATTFYRRATFGLATRLTNPRRWSLVLAVAPDAQMRSPALPSGTRRMRQGTGDLGQRLQNVFDDVPRGPVVVIGSDVPGISQVDIAQAFRVLEGHEAVIGPSPDGGYWLIGLRRRPRRMTPFRNIRWSTHEARSGTMSNLAGSRVCLVREMPDIDNGNDWRAHGSRRSRRILSAT
ncbi:MAG: TIGR04282 family arsenosugar biosynthesis glycosyltransferase [Hyphomicrobium sp.]